MHEGTEARNRPVKEEAGMKVRKLLALGVVALLALAACSNGDDPDTEAEGEASGTITVYSGRSEELVGPIIERFEQDTGIDAEVRYGDTAEMATQILEEGDNTPADVFWAQDAGALGAVAGEGRFATLPDGILDEVPAQYRSPDGAWVGTSGRARVLVYNTNNVAEDELPASILDLTGEAWRGRVGWAPTNGSFQAAVTAMRVVEGEDATRTWLEGMRDNDTQVYDGNSPIVQAVAAGEIDAGLVNHYYLLELGAEDPSITTNAANHFFEGGDVGSIVNAAGVGVIEGSDNADAAETFVSYLLSREGEQYFDEEVYEYPLGGDAEPNEALPPLESIDQPDIDLSDLDDLQGTIALLQETQLL